MAEDPALPLTDVQFVLGHAQLTTTQIYLTPRKEDVIRRVLAHHAEQSPTGRRAGRCPTAGARLPARESSRFSSVRSRDAPPKVRCRSDGVAAGADGRQRRGSRRATSMPHGQRPRQASGRRCRHA